MINEFSAAIEDVLWLVVIAFLAGVGVLVVSKRRGANTQTTMSRLAATWLVVALVGVWYLTLTPVGDSDSHPGSNLNLFAHVDMRNVVANVGLFVPLGLLARIAWVGARRPTAKALGLCVAVSLVVESTQWAFGLGRSADIQDLALNTMGGLLGVVAAIGVLRIATGSWIDTAPG
jgi:glycopeptide antibiotics resistance protein